MINIRESDYPNIMYLEVDGKAAKEDVEKAESFMNEHYGEKDTVNGLIDVKNIEGTEISGLLKGMLVDIKHWNQYERFAVITDSAWIESGTQAADIAPGIRLRQFDRAQKADAWEWLQK